MNFSGDFAAGRVVDETTGEAAYFLERRTPTSDFTRRHPQPGFAIEYPFEPSP